MHKQLSSSYESHDKEDLGFSLENIAHSNQERMLSFKENLFLELSGLNLVVLNDDILAKGLHGKDLSRVLLLHQEHLSKTASSDHFLDDEV